MLTNTPGTHKIEYFHDYVVFDLETTGLNFNRDKVVEISAIKVVDSKVTEEFSSFVNPECSIPFNASQLTGITDDMVADAPVFSDVLYDFLEFAGDAVLVGHNIHTFDLKFIYRDSREYFGKIPGNDYVDTLRLSMIYLPEMKKHTLSGIATYYGLSSEGAHRALADCRMNQAVYEELGKLILEKPNMARICPKCGEMLVQRNGKYGRFWGCSGYPECRYTEKMDVGC